MDIIQFTSIIVQFNKMSKIEFGGTKGKILTEDFEDCECRIEEVLKTVTKKVAYKLAGIGVEEIKGNFEDIC